MGSVQYSVPITISETNVLKNRPHKIKLKSYFWILENKSKIFCVRAKGRQTKNKNKVGFL